MAWSELDLGPSVWTQPVITQTQKYAATRTQIIHSQRLLRSTGKLKRSVPVKGLNLLTGKTNFQKGDYLFPSFRAAVSESAGTASQTKAGSFQTKMPEHESILSQDRGLIRM